MQANVQRADTLYYHRQVTPEQIRQVLQAHSEGSRLRAISRTTELGYNTVGRIVLGKVRAHIHAVLQKLEARDRTQTVLFALQKGLITNEPITD